MRPELIQSDNYYNAAHFAKLQNFSLFCLLKQTLNSSLDISFKKNAETEYERLFCKQIKLILL